MSQRDELLLTARVHVDLVRHASAVVNQVLVALERRFSTWRVDVSAG
ncbi:hypothetical protein ABZ403_30915 [Micromonospora zamorensis]